MHKNSTYFSYAQDEAPQMVNKNLAKNTVADGKIRAKSGSMTRVRCYTGYVTTQTGEKLVFVMMANNYSGKGSDMVKRMEKLMIMMAGLPF